MTQHTIAAPVLVLVIKCSTLLQHCQPYLYITVHCWHSTSPSDIQQSTTAPVPVLLIRHRTLLHKDQSYLYLYTKVHYWPSSSPVDTSQSTSDPVLVLLIPFSAILPQYLPCGYDTINYCQYQSYWYPTVHLCPSTRPALLILYSPLLPQHQSYWYLQSTTAPVPNLLIQHNPLLPLYESYWYPTVHYYPISSPTDLATVTVPVIWYTQSTTALVPVLLILHNPLLSQYQTYWYNVVSFCPSTSSTDTIQTTTAAVPVLLIWHSPRVPQYQSYWYPTVDPVPVPVLLIPYSPQLPQYQSFWFDTVHYCPSTSPSYTLQYIIDLVPVLFIRHSVLLSHYQSYW